MAIGSDGEIGVTFTLWGKMNDSSRCAWFQRMRDEWGADLVGGYGKVCTPRKLEEWEIDMDYTSWLRYGQSSGWISRVYCIFHEGEMLTDDEMQQIDEGEDPCVFGVRIFDLDAQEEAE